MMQGNQRVTEMKSFVISAKSFLSNAWKKGDGIHLSDIRPQKLVYSLAYAFELMLFACTQFMSSGTTLFGIPESILLFVSHMAASLVVMLLWSDKFKSLVWVSSVIMLFGFTGFVLLPDGYLRLIFGIFAMAGLGGAVTSARCGFAFAANNAERLIGMTVMFFSVSVIYFLSSVNGGVYVITTVLPLMLSALLAVCLFLFKEKDFDVKKEATKGDAKGLYWAFAFFMVYFAIDGYLWRLIDTNNSPAFSYLIVGMVLAGMILFVLLVWGKLNVWPLWNIFFLFTVIMAVLAVFAPQIGSDVPHYLFSGLSLIGWPLSIYMLACAQRRFASYALLKKCTLIYVLLSPFTTISDDIFAEIIPQSMPVVTLVYVLVTVFVFLALSPYSYKHLFSAEWISDLHKVDMEKIREKVEEVDKFEGYNLTPRQREVAVLLLAAKTRRQIAGELGLSESTVKLHTSELYKRMNINSRTELFRIFGVTDENESITAE